MAKQNNAEHVLAVATQATREARNRDSFLEDIQRETGQVVNLNIATDEIDYLTSLPLDILQERVPVTGLTGGLGCDCQDMLSIVLFCHVQLLTYSGVGC